MKELFNISATDECRLWKKERDDRFMLLKNLDQTLFDYQVTIGQVTSHYITTVVTSFLSI